MGRALALIDCYKLVDTIIITYVKIVLRSTISNDTI